MESMAQWAATVLIAVGLIATWIRNGRSQGAKYGKLEGKVDDISQNIKQDIKPELKNIHDGVSGMRTHCATVSTALSERVKHAEKQLDELRGSRS